MQLIRHLNDEELTDMLLESDERELQPMFRDLSGWLHTSTDLPDWFWQGQRAAIRRRVAVPRRSWSRPMLSWGAAMALVLVGLLLLQTSPAPKQVEIPRDPDQELLVAVERVVQSDGPSSLEPAGLLAEEISSSVSSRPDVTTHRENRNEN